MFFNVLKFYSFLKGFKGFWLVDLDRNTPRLKQCLVVMFLFFFFLLTYLFDRFRSIRIILFSYLVSIVKKCCVVLFCIIILSFRCFLQVLFKTRYLPDFRVSPGWNNVGFGSAAPTSDTLASLPCPKPESHASGCYTDHASPWQSAQSHTTQLWDGCDRCGWWWWPGSGGGRVSVSVSVLPCVRIFMQKFVIKK